MIKILSKFVVDGEIVAWHLINDEVEFNIAYRALYHEFFFESLIEAGYKFHDYDCNVTSPDGVNIKDLEECKEYLYETELIDLIDAIEVGMLEEKDIVQYFEWNTDIKYIELPVPERTAINSREELDAYLETVQAANKHNMHKFSCRSINDITNPSFLYSLEEVVSNENGARDKFIACFGNMLMESKSEFDKTLEYFNINKEGMSDNQIMSKVLREYFRYGIPGLNCKILSIENHDIPVSSYEEYSMGKEPKVLLKYGIRNKSDYKFYSEDVFGKDYGDLSGDDDFDTSAHLGAYSITSIKPVPVSDDYEIVGYGYKKVIPYITFNVISEDGITATFVANTDYAHLYCSGKELVSTIDMFRLRTIDEVNIPFSRLCYANDTYIEDSVIIRAYIAEQLKRSTVVPKYDNSYKLMTGIGVSPYYAPMYINRLIKGGIEQYVEISDVNTFSKLHYNCSDTFRDGFSSYILEKYGSDEEEFAERPLSEQIEFINEEISNLQTEGKYLVKPDIPAGSIKLGNPEYEAWFDEYWANEVDNVNFVYSLLNGEQNIGKLSIGMQLDNVSDRFKLFCVIYGALMKARESNESLSCREFLLSEITNIVELDKLFVKKQQTAIGCAKDILLFRSDMAASADTLLFITKVFRENSNVDNVTRHYGFECIAYGKEGGSKGGIIFRSLYEQIANNLMADNHKDCLSVVADTVALLIMNIFTSNTLRTTCKDGIYYINVETVLIDGSKYTCEVKLGEKYYAEIKTGSLFQKKYCSNYDFCENQFNKATIKCDFYCVNASINPWAIVPREGFKIPEFNIFVNYFKLEELEKVYPKSIINKINNSGAKVISCLRESFGASELIPSMDFMIDKVKEQEMARKGFFLSKKEHEDIEAYMNRTMNDIRVYKSQGKAVKNTVLKSDIMYNNFKQFTYIDGVEDTPTFYDEFSGPVCNRHVSNMAPRILGQEWCDDVINGRVLIPEYARSVRLERIKFSDLEFEDILYNKELLCNEFNTNNISCITKGTINYGNNKSKSIYDLSISDLEDICNEGYGIQLTSNTAVIKTLNGLIKVGV